MFGKLGGYNGCEKSDCIMTDFGWLSEWTGNIYKMSNTGKHPKTIFRQFLVFSLLISLVPIILASTILFKNLENTAEKELNASYKQIGLQYINNIKDKFTRLETGILVVSKNTIISEQLLSKTDSPYIKGESVSEEIFKSLLLEGRNEINNCMVYTKVKGGDIYGRSASTWEVAKKEGWYGYYKNTPGKWFIHPSLTNKNLQINIASIVYEIYNLDTKSLVQNNIGAVKLDVNLNRMFRLTSRDRGNNSFDVILSDEEGNILYSETAMDKEIQKKILSNDSINENASFTIDDYVIYNFKLNNLGLNVLLAFGNKELISKKSQIINIFFPTLFVLICIVVMVSGLFAKRFSKRVNLLVDKFKAAETGDLSVKKAITGDDEISILDEHFSHMLVKLDKLIKTNYVQELDRKKLELKNLQLQINPHFLYNTLETISSIAAVNKVFIIGDIAGKLGEIFRYSLGKNYGDFVSLNDELKHIENYIFIQKVRYGDKLEVFYDIENGVEDCLIPRFILQPIIENSILHGIAPKATGGTIEINVSLEESKLVIRIEDDGIGMDSDYAELINAKINSPVTDKEDSTGVGIRNVNQRIKFIYGNEYGLKLKSSVNCGSSCIISFPAGNIE